MGLQLDLKTLFNPKDKEQIISWLQAVRPTSSCLWGKVVPAPDGSLSDGFRMCMDQKPVNPARLSYPGSEVGCPLGPNPLAEGVQNGAGAGPEGRRDSARGVSQRRARAKESRRSLHAATRNLPMASPIADYRAWRVPVWIVVFLCEVGRCIPAIVSWLAPESGLLRTGQASSKAQKQQGSSALRLLPSWLEPVGFFFSWRCRLPRAPPDFCSLPDFLSVRQLSDSLSGQSTLSFAMPYRLSRMTLHSGIASFVILLLAISRRRGEVAKRLAAEQSYSVQRRGYSSLPTQSRQTKPDESLPDAHQGRSWLV